MNNGKFETKTNLFYWKRFGCNLSWLLFVAEQDASQICKSVVVVCAVKTCNVHVHEQSGHCRFVCYKANFCFSLQLHTSHNAFGHCWLTCGNNFASWFKVSRGVIIFFGSTSTGMYEEIRIIICHARYTLKTEWSKQSIISYGYLRPKSTTV